jgi:hypothetical protein
MSAICAGPRTVVLPLHIEDEVRADFDVEREFT